MVKITVELSSSFYDVFSPSENLTAFIVNLFEVKNIILVHLF